MSDQKTKKPRGRKTLAAYPADQANGNRRVRVDFTVQLTQDEVDGLALYQVTTPDQLAAHARLALDLDLRARADSARVAALDATIAVLLAWLLSTPRLPPGTGPRRSERNCESPTTTP